MIVIFILSVLGQIRIREAYRSFLMGETDCQGETGSCSDGRGCVPSLLFDQAMVGVMKSLLMKVEDESKEAGLKLIIQKAKIMASSPIASWQIDGKQWKQ